MPVSMVGFLLCLGAIASVVRPADANVFLRSGKGALEQVRVNDVEAALSSELAAALGGGHGEAKISQMERALRPMYDILPKNSFGNLGRASVRYALRRFFVQKHGWFVKGLESAASAPNVSSPTAMLKDRVPSYIEDLFEQQFGGLRFGFGLRALAELAATLEHLVHDEAMGRLQASYQAHHKLPTDLINEQEAYLIIEVYMISKIVGTDLSNVTTEQIEGEKRRFPGWRDTQTWLRDLQLGAVYTDRGFFSNPFVSGQLSFARVAHVVEEVGDRYGRIQDICRGLKQDLLERQGGQPGRVPLSNFYRTGRVARWRFNEGIDYLRQVGALDESDPKMPSVIVPNYVSGHSNCLGGSSFYSVCCISECDELLGHLEKEIATPTADPHQIAALVAALPSDTVDAPRNLSSSLVGRLDSIAQRHDGRVPLHGRLFAQWMHHAYPYGCPYPQLMAKWDSPLVTSSKSEMTRWLDSVPSDVVNRQLPWTDVEDLLEDLEASPARVVRTGLWFDLRNVGLVMAIVSMVVSMARTCKSAFSSFYHGKPEKLSV